MNHEFRFTAKKISQRIELIEKLVYRQKEEIPAFHFQELATPLDISLTQADINDENWEVIKAYDYWARPRVNFILRTAFRVPSDWSADHKIGLFLPLGEPGSFSHPEALIYIDGKHYATVDRHHQEVLLLDKWRDGFPHTLALHGWTGNYNKDGDMARLLMRSCVVALIDQPTRDFIALARTALGTANVLDDDDPAKGRLYNALDAAFKLLNILEPVTEAFYESIPTAYQTLKSGIETAGQPLDVSIIAAGHAHIDVAWLWTLGQTRQKAARTFQNALRLMEQFPDYHFTQSQPQLYDYIRQDYPALFEAIKEAVAGGRWEIIGGMWVEADCNITGSESLARQFLIGRSFFREHFGAETETPVLWLPDVFGYAWNLPQLIKEAGLEYFFTIKIGWNLHNRLPYDSFWWQGLDGTKVLTHFSTTPDERNLLSNATYNAFPHPGTALYSWKNLQQKEVVDGLLMSYGYGDGGGGPTREMLENIREMKAFPGLPQMRYGKVFEFFRELEEKSGEQLPIWNGELYLEVHRGTYTTQSGNKRANRKTEFLLHDAEYLASLASLLGAEYEYPIETFRKAWELVCLNQFHDIIPGSSIGEVYTESLLQYGEVKDMADAARDEALEVITNHIDGSVLVINPTGFARNDLALWVEGAIRSDQQLQMPNGRGAATQDIDEGILVSVGEIAPYSIVPLKVTPGTVTRVGTGLSVNATTLKNNFVQVEINKAGDITRIYDRINDREVLPAGAVANQFLAFEDRPHDWDAWDIDMFYDDKMWLAEPATSVNVVEHGPLRVTLEISRKILHSEYTQRISLFHNSPRIDIETTIEWQERHVLLKSAFPVEVFSPTATYEVQWGNVERPTHRNTSWDWARFETVAQKWVDLSEGDYGVSLLNDCKYGHDIHENVIRITLLRSPTSPDPEADQGLHRFTYSVFPHAGRWNEATISAAYALNDPLIVAEGKSETANHALLDVSLLHVDKPNIVIETVKRAEDGNGLIVRLYESQRRRGKVTLKTGFKVAHAMRTNILEETKTKLNVNDGADHAGSDVLFDVHPYEIVTLRLVPA